MPTDYLDLEDLPHSAFKVLSQEQTQQINKQWLQTFGKSVGSGGARGYKWQVFEEKLYSAIEGEAAKQLYFQQKAADYIILPNNIALEQAVIIDQLPDLTDFYEDYCVFPANMAWTMAFTHEVGWIDPFFAKHKDYQKRVAENACLIQKKQEIAAAKGKGWM